MDLLTGFLANLIRPLIREEIEGLKTFIAESVAQRSRFKEFDKEADELITQAQQATTTEEVHALLSRLNAARAKLR